MYEAWHTRSACGLQQVMRAFDVGLHKRRGIFDAAIDMALSREVNDGITTAHLLDHATIADVHLHELAAAVAQCGLRFLRLPA